MSGFSEAKLNEALNTLCRGGWFGQMHLDDPGVGGLLHPSDDDERTQVLFSEADGALIESTGEPAGWNSTEAQIIKWISFWDGMDPETSNWVGNAELPKQVKLANGDVFQLSSVVAEFVQGKAF